MRNGQQTKTARAAAAPTAAATSRSRNERHASGAAPSPPLTVDNIQFECLKSIYYHEDRERFLVSVRKALLFIAILTGTAWFVSFSTGTGLINANYVVGLVTVASIVEWVADFCTKASLHAALRKSFFELRERSLEPSANVHELERCLNRLYSDEPAAYQVVLALAYNKAIDTLGRPVGARIVVPAWRRVGKNLSPAGSFRGITENEHSGSVPQAYPQKG
jgi:hypothetical protein